MRYWISHNVLRGIHFSYWSKDISVVSSAPLLAGRSAVLHLSFNKCIPRSTIAGSCCSSSYTSSCCCCSSSRYIRFGSKMMYWCIACVLRGIKSCKGLWCLFRPRPCLPCPADGSCLYRFFKKLFFCTETFIYLFIYFLYRDWYFCIGVIFLH